MPDEIVTDLAGDPCFVDDPFTEDTGLGAPPLVDNGAYEHQAPQCPADVTGDGEAGVYDLVSVLGKWGFTTDIPEDIDGDRVVDALDLIYVLTMWRPCP